LTQSTFVYHISYETFQRKILANSSYYIKRKVEKKRVGSLWKLSEFYIAEFLDSYFHLWGCGYHHDRVDVDALAPGIGGFDEDPMVLYLGYYDKSYSQ
jgi:hypothetical protein